MLGPSKLRRLDQTIAVLLGNLVPSSNVTRHLEARLDMRYETWLVVFRSPDQP